MLPTCRINYISLGCGGYIGLSVCLFGLFTIVFVFSVLISRQNLLRFFVNLYIVLMSCSYACPLLIRSPMSSADRRLDLFTGPPFNWIQLRRLVRTTKYNMKKSSISNKRSIACSVWHDGMYRTMQHARTKLITFVQWYTESHQVRESRFKKVTGSILSHEKKGATRVCLIPA